MILSQAFEDRHFRKGSNFFPAALSAAGAPAGGLTSRHKLLTASGCFLRERLRTGGHCPGNRRALRRAPALAYRRISLALAQFGPRFEFETRWPRTLRHTLCNQLARSLLPKCVRISIAPAFQPYRNARRSRSYEQGANSDGPPSLIRLQKIRNRRRQKSRAPFRADEQSWQRSPTAERHRAFADRS